MRRMRSQSNGSAIVLCRCSTGPRSALRRHGLHLAQRRQAPERFKLDLPDAFARQTEPPSDLLERLRRGVAKASLAMPTKEEARALPAAPSGLCSDGLHLAQ